MAIISAFQAEDTGSTPVTRSKIKLASNRALVLFLG